MLNRNKVRMMFLVSCSLAVCGVHVTKAADPAGPDLKSQVVRRGDAKSRVTNSVETRQYFSGTTFATKDVFVATVVIQPGKSNHKSHRHAEEEYMVLIEGTGTWSLDGKDFPAQDGDMVYAEPWVYHGFTNTGDKPSVYAVVRYKGKGVPPAPRPDDRPNEPSAPARPSTPKVEGSAAKTEPASPAGDADTNPLFNGKDLAGWEGNLKIFRIEDGAIVGGTLKEKVDHTDFLCTKKEYGNFELRLKVKLVGKGANGGIQVRSRRVPDSYEVSGYQADMGPDRWGNLLDESRRRKVLAKPTPEVLAKAYRPDQWNEYLIRCEGPRIRLSLNGVETTDYTETNAKIPLTGIIGLQTHRGGPNEAWYKDIVVRELPAAAAAK